MSEWSQIAFGNGRFVAVSSGDGQRAAWSTDGMTWNTPTTTLPNNAWRWVTYGNGMFVAVGYSGTRRVATSINGETWNLVDSALTNNGAWQSVTYGNGRFVAVANNGTRVITSQNGTSWTAASDVPAGEWSTVAYGNGMFIALSFGSNPRAMSSPDGITWTARTMPSGGWMDAIYGGGQFVAVSWTDNHIATSPDGITWTARSVPDSRSWGAIAYTGGHYIVVGGGGSGPNRMMVSSDGIEWVPQPIPHENQSLSTVTWGNDTLVVTGHDLYPGTPQFFIGDCPVGCYMPTAKKGAREWFETADSYKFCDGEAWRDFSNDGTAGSCSVAGQMEWDDAQAVHTMCDGAQRQILRYAGTSSCSLTSEMLKIGAAATGGTALDYPNAFAVYDNGSKAVVHARWSSRISTWDLSAAPGAPSLIATSPTVSGRTDVQGVAVRNGHVFISSPDRNGTGRIWASPLSDITTSYSFPTSGAVGGNNMCNAHGLAMNDAGTVAFVPAWDSGGASCPSSPAESGACILNIFDTTDPANISSVAHVNVSSMISNGNVYCNGAFWRDSKLFLSFATGPGHGGIAILDVSNSASPTLIGQRWLDGIGNSQIDEMDITPNGNLLILASRVGRVVSMDVSNPANPTILDDSLFLTSSGWTNSVAIVNDYAFISTDPNHIHAVNISDPENLVVDAIISDNMVEDIGHLHLVGENIYYTSIGNDRFGLLELSCDVENSGPPDLGACSRMAAIDFEPDMPLYKYCDGSNWRPMNCVIPESDRTTCYEPNPFYLSNMGATMDGSRKWMGSVVANSKIYAIPSASTDILVIDPSDTTHGAYGTATRTAMGASIPGSDMKWGGGVVAANGKIYGIPDSSNNILVIDPSDTTGSPHGTATLTTMGASLSGGEKWFFGARASNGKIYGIPYSASNILVIDPSDLAGGPHGTATRTAMGASLSGAGKWCGGALASNGKIYGMPYSATNILVIDPSDTTGGPHGTATRTSMGLTIPSGEGKWCNPIEGSNGKLYAFPLNDTDQILVIDPFDMTGGPHGTATLSSLNATIPSGSWKWLNSVRGPDGRVYSIPEYATSILAIDLENLAGGPHGVASISHNLPASGGFSGGHTVNNRIYMTPLWADTILVTSFTEGNCVSSIEEQCAVMRDPCVDSPGTVCGDGTVYAGLSPDGNVPMFTTRCDAGQSWNGSACTGTRPYLPWNHGGGGPLPDWLLIEVSSPTNGTANTATLFTADASSNAGQQNHLAARHCGNLNEGGHSDWYLPSIDELEVLARNRTVIGGFGINYWSSTEASRTHAMANDFWGPLSGNRFSVEKNANIFARCVRKGG